MFYESLCCTDVLRNEFRGTFPCLGASIFIVEKNSQPSEELFFVLHHEPSANTDERHSLLRILMVRPVEDRYPVDRRLKNVVHTAVPWSSEETAAHVRYRRIGIE